MTFQTPVQSAITYVLGQIQLPAGQGLWINCQPLADGEVYSPWHGIDPESEIPAGALRGYKIHSSIDTLAAAYDYVVLNSGKQLAEAAGHLALALQRSKGLVIVAAAKDAGGGRLADMLGAYGVASKELSKSRCRVVWTFEAPKAERAALTKNLTLLAPRLVALDEASWWTVPGLFGWDKVDAGSRLLVKHLPQDLHGSVADFGCGYGYISKFMAQRPLVTKVDAIDADARAVDLAARNGGEKIQPLWHNIATSALLDTYDAVVMNPPFHAGKSENVSLGETFVRKAWESLKPRGRLLFVANRHLPYEKIIPGMTLLHEADGFKIITAIKTKPVFATKP